MTTTARSNGQGQVESGIGERVTESRFLALLPSSDRARIVEASTLVTLKSQDIVSEPNEFLTHVYIPLTGIISLVTRLDHGAMEAMTVGNDGFVGLAVYNGVTETTSQQVCQVPGDFLRMDVGTFAGFLDEMPSLRRVAGRYAQLVLEMLGQSAACNRLHVVEERCARWLLLTHDRVNRDAFELTQGFLSQMLGVRRPGVTVAIGVLTRAGLISHTRGIIRIENRDRLQQASCECYAAMKHRQDALLN
jgi:CRP-like cAMP-binding protein